MGVTQCSARPSPIIRGAEKEAKGAPYGAGLLNSGTRHWVQVSEETTNRQFAMKRMAKSAAMQCPEHVFCEQQITRNMAHPFCLRQYASFQVGAVRARVCLVNLEEPMQQGQALVWGRFAVDEGR